MKHVFSILILLSVIAFSGVTAENKGSPAGIENYQSYEPPAIASIEAISVSEVTAFDSGNFVYLNCEMISPAQIFVAVDSGQGFRRSQSAYTSNKECDKSGGLFKPGTNT